MATLPTRLDLLLKGRLPGQALARGDLVMFASVGGGGMNASAIRRVLRGRPAPLPFPITILPLR